jgi:hypothetical protein
MQSRLFTLALLLTSIISSVFAQSPTTQQTGRSPLVLVVVQNPELPPNNQPLPDVSGFMYYRFARIKGWQEPPGSRKVTSVYVTSVMEGESVTVRVAALYGSGDSGSVLGAFPIRENETLTVNELKRVGIEPFTITLKRIAPFVPPSPQLKNETKGVDIVGVQAAGMSLPSYQLTLRNVSPKNITSLAISILVEKQNVGGAFLEGEEGKPLIESGGLYIADNLLITKSEIQSGSFSPTPSSVLIVVAGLTYQDGQYEGSEGSFRLHLGKVLGQKTFIRGLLRLIDSELAATNSDQPDPLLRFKEKLLQLQFDIDDKDATFKALIKPNSDPKFLAEGTIRFLRRRLVGDIDALLAFPSPQRPSLNQWLSSARTRYADWLARLEQ